MRANCFNCKHAFITSDESVGISSHLEACKSNRVLKDIYDIEEVPEDVKIAFQLDNNFNLEDYYALICGSWEPIIREAKCEVCKKEFKFAEGMWDYYAPFEYPVCSRECCKKAADDYEKEL